MNAVPCQSLGGVLLTNSRAVLIPRLEKPHLYRDGGAWHVYCSPTSRLKSGVTEMLQNCDRANLAAWIQNHKDGVMVIRR